MSKREVVCACVRTYACVCVILDTNDKCSFKAQHRQSQDETRQKLRRVRVLIQVRNRVLSNVFSFQARNSTGE